MNWQALADSAAWFFLAYFVALGAGYLLLNVCALFELPRQLEGELPELLPRPHAGYEPPVSAIIASGEDVAKLITTIHAVLHLDYPEFEVVVINDGSRTGTLEALTREFLLAPFPEANRRQIETRHVRGVRRSTRFPKLRVVDKEPGGKADALNAGINAARYPLVCVVDVDTILERTSLRQVVQPFLTERHTVAAGGCLRIANGSDVRGGLLVNAGLPRRMLPMAQVVEYLRAFVFSRLGWAPMNAVPMISRAFGVFRKDALVAAGGYRGDVVGEDMELVMRLHRLNRLAGRDYRIAFLIRPVCWTMAPESHGALRNQRIRLQRGLGESLAHNRELLFHRRGGAAGWIMFPFMLVFELLGPVIEITAYLFMLAGFAFGFVSAATFWSFLLLAISLGMLLSISALLLEEISCQSYRRPGNFFVLVFMALVENIGYHQLMMLWRLQGVYRWLLDSRARS